MKTDAYYIIMFAVLAFCAWVAVDDYRYRKKKKIFDAMHKKVVDFILRADRNSLYNADTAGKMVEDLTDLAFDKETRSEAQQQLYCWKAKFSNLYK